MITCFCAKSGSIASRNGHKACVIQISELQSGVASDSQYHAFYARFLCLYCYESEFGKIKLHFNKQLL